MSSPSTGFSPSGGRGHHRVDLSDLEQSLKRALAIVESIPRENLRPRDWLEAAAQVGTHLAESREALAGVRQDIVGGARTALLLYFRSHPGDALSPNQLEGVAAIRAWPRRIRELREVGWEIDTIGAGAGAPYRLEAAHLDEAVAASDDTIASVAGSSPGERLIEYLLHISPWTATPLQLERVAKVPTWRQEIRDLIDQGWLIQSNDDDPTIAPGHFRLANLES